MSEPGQTPAEACRADRRRRLSAARADISGAMLKAWETHGLTQVEIAAAAESLSHEMMQHVLLDDRDRQARSAARRAARDGDGT